MKISAVVPTILFLSISLSACSSNMQVGLDPEANNLPTPVFEVSNKELEGQSPAYSRVRVFSADGICEIPECPVIWQVVVSVDSSPSRLTFGKLPSFGAVSIVPPQDLQTKKNYILRLDYDPSVPPTDTATFRFHVNEQGVARPGFDRSFFQSEDS